MRQESGFFAPGGENTVGISRVRKAYSVQLFCAKVIWALEKIWKNIAKRSKNTENTRTNKVFWGFLVVFLGFG